jgi:ADP-ribose pyrophosphatase YjhB (NUDIX family)
MPAKATTPIALTATGNANSAAAAAAAARRRGPWPLSADAPMLISIPLSTTCFSFVPPPVPLPPTPPTIPARFSSALGSSLFLTVKKARDQFAWAFPQGGYEPDKDGEHLRNAAARELAEECGANLRVFFYGHSPVFHIEYLYDANSPGTRPSQGRRCQGLFLSGNLPRRRRRARQEGAGGLSVDEARGGRCTTSATGSQALETGLFRSLHPHCRHARHNCQRSEQEKLSGAPLVVR